MSLVNNEVCRNQSLLIQGPAAEIPGYPGLHSFEQFREGYIECLCNLDGHRQGNILFAPLDGSHVAAVESARIRELHLGKS